PAGGRPSPLPVVGPVTGGLPSPSGWPCRQRRSSMPLSLAQGSSITGGLGCGSGLVGTTQRLPTRTVPGRQVSGRRQAPSSMNVPGGHTGGTTTTTGGPLGGPTTGGPLSIGLTGRGGSGVTGLLTGNGFGSPPCFGFTGGQF